ncbi:MAG: DUF6597 domain-containing transcriptional factor [Dysgonomonas sp.]|nr:DUF6597 domain-containing transcriptional factor [Dysgonomonas sp.]
MYKECKSHPLLTQYIETYWAIEGFVPGGANHRVLPDGCVDIIFSFDVKTGKLKPLIVGTMTVFEDVLYSGEFKMIGVRFNPGGITALTRIPVWHFTNSKIDAFSAETIFNNQFYEGLEGKTTEDIFSYIDSFLLGKLSSLIIPDQRIQYAISLIRKHNGNFSIAELAEKSCLSNRQFERRFLSAVGVSAKTFSRIIRFRNTCNFIQTTTQQSLFDTAIDCGYYDHAHLIKDFKSLSGYSPKEL